MLNLKNNSFAAKLIFLSMFLFVSVSHAQTPPKEQQNLMQFEGKWVDKNPKVIMGGKTYQGEYSFDCSLVNMGTGILAHEKFVNDEAGFTGENLLGFDPNLRQVHLYSVDNVGTAHDHYGFWVNDKHLFVQYQGVVEGKMYVEQIDMIFKDANTMYIKLTGMLNGETAAEFEGTFKKQ